MLDTKRFKTIEASMQAIPFPALPDLSLASGVAGILLVQTVLWKMSPSTTRRQYIEYLVSLLVDQIPKQNLLLGLWTGLTGILYALEFVWRINPDLLGSARDDISEFVIDMDATLCTYLSNPSARSNYDLIGGLCGMGTYALMRVDSEAAQRLYRTTESVLFELAERRGDTLHWKTPAQLVPPSGTPADRRAARYDLGIAHGVGGVIGLLSAGVRRGFGSAHAQEMLRHTVDGLLLYENRALAHSTFPSVISADEQPGHSKVTSRLGWCYGDLGGACVLSNAADVLSDPILKAKSQTILEKRLAEPEESFQLDSIGLCHGKSGVLHILTLLCAGAYLPRASAMRARLYEQINAHINDEFASLGSGLLEGWAGVLLVMAEESAPSAAGTVPWNLCLLTAL